MKEATLPPGRYYIGDPCFILTEEDESDFNQAISWKPEDAGYDPWVAGVVYKTGEIAYRGQRMALYQAKHGDESISKLKAQ